MSDQSETERRRGLHELADSIRCLHTAFSEAKIEFTRRFDSLENDLKNDIDWREKEAKPALDAVRRAMNVVTGVGLSIGALTAIVAWIFLRSYGELHEVAKATVENSKSIAVLTEIQRIQTIQHEKYEQALIDRIRKEK